MKYLKTFEAKTKKSKDKPVTLQDLYDKIEEIKKATDYLNDLQAEQAELENGLMDYDTQNQSVLKDFLLCPK